MSVKEGNISINITLDKRVVESMDNCIEAINKAEAKKIGGRVTTRSKFIQVVLVHFLNEVSEEQAETLENKEDN